MNDRQRRRLLRSPWVLVVIFLVTRHSSLVTRAADPPFYAPPAGFYGAVGTDVKTTWAVDRTSVSEGEAITATLTVRGATNPTEVTRPDLRKLDEYQKRFEIDDVPGPAATAGAKEVTFVYRLRPRNRQVNRLPSLDFPYRHPGIAAGSPFQNAKARGIDLVVTAAPPKPGPPPVPLAEPDHLFAVPAGPGLLGPAPFAPGGWACPAAVLLGPLAAGGWYLAWRRLYPGAARAARIRRRRAADRAARAIRRSAKAVDPAAAVGAAVVGYLAARFPLPPGADTPAEVGDALTAGGLAAGPTGEVVGFLRRCDAARFGGPGDGGVSLDEAALALLARLEAEE